MKYHVSPDLSGFYFHPIQKMPFVFVEYIISLVSLNYRINATS